MAEQLRAARGGMLSARERREKISAAESMLMRIGGPGAETEEVSVTEAGREPRQKALKQSEEALAQAMQEFSNMFKDVSGFNKASTENFNKGSSMLYDAMQIYQQAKGPWPK
jgi:hypothetical protein